MRTSQDPALRCQPKLTTSALRSATVGAAFREKSPKKAMQTFFTTKPVGKGTGLGLSISNAIAEAHHGRVWIHSRGPNTPQCSKNSLLSRRRGQP